MLSPPTSIDNAFHTRFGFFFTFSSTKYKGMTCLLQSVEQWWALVLSFFTSTIIFARRILVLNKYDRILSRTGVVTWGISLTSGLLFWTTLNALRADIVLQLATGVLSTTLAWLTYVLLINDSLRYPTMQQWISLFFHIFTEALILLQVRLVFDSVTDECTPDVSTW